MKCLYLAHRVPYPPNKGEKLRTYYQLVYLQQKGVQITVLAPTENSQDQNNATALQEALGCNVITAPLGNKIVRYAHGILRNQSLSESHFYSSELQHSLDDLITEGNYSALLCSASSMAGYVFRSKAIKQQTTIKTIMDFMDLDSNKWTQYVSAASFPMSWVYRREANRVAKLEQQIGQQFDSGFFVAEPETQLYKAAYPEAQANIATIGNGIAPEEFYPSPKMMSLEAPHLLFAGVMDYAPNIDAMLWFTSQVWPAVKQRWPAAKLTIAGMNPSAEITALARDEQIEVTGFVDDILPYFHRANLFVAPFRIARGVQNKILQAFACGLPVITSPMGAEGILCQHNDNLLIADSPDDFFDAISQLLTDTKCYETIRENALETIDSHYSWQGKLAPLNGLVGIEE